MEKSKDTSINKVDVKDTCLGCGESIYEDELVLCSDCGAHHHDYCWREHKGCTADDCECRISEKAKDGNSPIEDAGDDEKWYYLDSDGSLVIDSHLTYVETPIAGGMVLGCMGIIAGWMFNAWLLANSWYLFGSCLTILLIMGGCLRHRLRINSAGGAITRKLMFAGLTLSNDNSYLFLNELAELHLHCEETNTDDEEENSEDTFSEEDANDENNEDENSEDENDTNEDKNKNTEAAKSRNDTTEEQPKKYEYILFGINLDSEIKPMFVRESRNGKEVLKLVSKIAAVADCTVRFFKKDEEPSPQEIAEAIKQRRIEARLD